MRGTDEERKARARLYRERHKRGLHGGRLGGILAPSRITGPQSISAHYSRGPSEVTPSAINLEGDSEARRD